MNETSMSWHQYHMATARRRQDCTQISFPFILSGTSHETCSQNESFPFAAIFVFLADSVAFSNSTSYDRNDSAVFEADESKTEVIGPLPEELSVR
jgi:hypothetical protein